MTQAEALQEARKRWGKKAVAAIGAKDAYTGEHTYCVSNHRGFNHTVVRGYGDSWEAAFADAARREGAK